MSTDLHGRTTRSTPGADEDRDAGARTTNPPPDPPARLGLSAAQVVGGALAAMTAAALGSRLSVAGTVVGAALASVVAAVAGSLYTTSLKRTHQRVAAAWQGRRHPAAPDVPESPLAGPPTTDHDRPATPTRRRRVGTKTVVAGAAAIFVVAVLALTGIELLTGHALSGGSGTTVTQVTERRSTVPSDPSPAPVSPSTTQTRPSAPSAAPSSTPTAESSASSTPSASASPTGPSTPAGSDTASPTPGTGPDEPSVARTP